MVTDLCRLILLSHILLKLIFIRTLYVLFRFSNSVAQCLAKLSLTCEAHLSVMIPLLCLILCDCNFPEIKNIVTIATGEWGGDSGERCL